MQVFQVGGSTYPLLCGKVAPNLAASISHHFGSQSPWGWRTRVWRECLRLKAPAGRGLGPQSCQDSTGNGQAASHPAGAAAGGVKKTSFHISSLVWASPQAAWVSSLQGNWRWQKETENGERETRVRRRDTPGCSQDESHSLFVLPPQRSHPTPFSMLCSLGGNHCVLPTVERGRNYTGLSTPRRGDPWGKFSRLPGAVG